MFPFIFAENIDTFIDQDTSQPGAEILSLRQMADRPVAGLDRVLNGVCDIFVICKIRPGNFIHTLFIHFYQPDKCPSVALLCFCDKMFQRDPLLSFCRVHGSCFLLSGTSCEITRRGAYCPLVH